MRPVRGALRVPALLVLLALVSGGAAAHAGTPAEARVDFPPWVAWAAGALVVALSFLVIGASERGARPAGPRAQSSQAAARKPRPTLRAGTRLAAALALALALVPAFAPVLPAAPGLALLALVYLLPLLSYLLGNAWEPVNPFRLVRLPARLPYPSWLGAWPAVVVVLALAGLEVSAFAGEPQTLARLLLAYVVVTFAGMLLFGTEAWLANAEAFGAAARWWASASPVLSPRTWRTRAPPPAGRAGETALVVALLWVVNFDGVLATAAGRSARAAWGEAAVPLLLLAGFALFLAAFLAAVALLRRAAESLAPPALLASRLAPALVPVAVAYHAAHALPALLESVASIPSWALPWIGGLQVAVILAGHVLAVAFAHRLAVAAFPSRVMAVKGEVPLTAAMVVYTIVGLMILTGGA